MPVLALGVSHRLASVDLLERLAVSAEEAPKAYRRLLDLPAVTEAVILSTCNRVEVYAEVATYHAGFLALKRFLSETGEMDPDAFAEPLYARYEDEAAEHLFTVAAGMDSMVLGEPQILSQVRAAFRRAQAEGAAGPVMLALFRAAVRAGRRVRSGTAIGTAPESMVLAGVELADRRLGGVEGRPAAVVGAGQMAALALGVLRGRGAGPIAIANRSPDRARLLAERHGATGHGLDALGRALGDAEIVVACTGAAGIMVGAREVADALRGRTDPARMFVLDLAVPRDVDPAAGELPGVTLANVDDLSEALDRGCEAREAVAAGTAIVAREVATFAEAKRAARLAPLFHELRERAELIRRGELSRSSTRLRELSPGERDAIEAMTKAIVAKLLHDPIVRVRGQDAAGGHLDRALAELFGLDPPARR
jgi:glutamyl-tRNA reductase